MFALAMFAVLYTIGALGAFRVIRFIDESVPAVIELPDEDRDPLVV